MEYNNGEGMAGYEISRREFLKLTALAGAGLVIGCAANPVTGKSQLMLVSEDTEIKIDREYSPHQFSADYGIAQDGALNNYLEQTGKALASRTHRSHMLYSFRAVNATYINAYTFPGGSVAATRGILLNLGNEGELAGLLGHELGHVNARHTAEQMSKTMLASAVIGGVTRLTSAALGDLAEKLGMLGAGILLASYSRDNEREADALGMEYMVRAGYSPEGLVGLMDMLRGMSRRKPGVIELMFATHPMSDERYNTAKTASQGRYKTALNLPVHRDRYMDHTAGLRKIRGAIEEMQNGEGSMARQKYSEAEGHFLKALKVAPDDYAGLVMMSKCQLIQEKYAEALYYAETAKQVYPQEAQAYHINGFIKIKQGKHDSAFQEFSAYEKLLPGNPNTLFFKGLSQEGMKKTKEAAQHYYRYLQLVNQGKQAEHAYRRLIEWGYLKPKK